MKLIILLILVAFNAGNCGPIKTMATDHPEQMLAFIDNASYTELLKFIQDAYAESKADNDEVLTQYAYMYALGNASLEKRIPLSVDFLLSKQDMDLNEAGAKMIVSAVLSGGAVNAELRQQAITKLKAKLVLLVNPSRGAFDFAWKAGEALVVLGDDSGLDIFLTDKQTSGNYSRMDHWTPTSDATVFEGLKQQYELKAADPANTNKEIEKVMAATYELCRLRRVQSKEINPLQPLADLQKLLP